MAGGTGRLRHYQVEIPTPAAAIQLSSGISAGGRADQFDRDVAMEWIKLQPDTGEAVIRVGGDEDVSASEGLVVQVAAAGDEPLHLPGPLKLSDVWVIGTAGDLVNVLAKTL